MIPNPLTQYHQHIRDLDNAVQALTAALQEEAAAKTRLQRAQELLDFAEADLFAAHPETTNGRNVAARDTAKALLRSKALEDPDFAPDVSAAFRQLQDAQREYARSRVRKAAAELKHQTLTRQAGLWQATLYYFTVHPAEAIGQKRLNDAVTEDSVQQQLLDLGF